MTSAFVGLGEGIGNVLMGLPLVDALARAGRDVTVHLRATPREIGPDLLNLVSAGRGVAWLVGPQTTWMEREETYDEAFLTHWWLRQGGGLPTANQVRVADAIDYSRPEITQNLDTLAGIVEPDDEWGRVTLHASGGASHEKPLAVIHPGCKPQWRGKKCYPRWAELVHRLKEDGLTPFIVGGDADKDIYCGEPAFDQRGRWSLAQTAAKISKADVFISGDSGLHHMAVALGVPTVAIFGDSSAIKARHPNPAGPRPVILGPFPDAKQFAAVEPWNVVRAAKHLIESRQEVA